MVIQDIVASELITTINTTDIDTISIINNQTLIIDFISNKKTIIIHMIVLNFHTYSS